VSWGSQRATWDDLRRRGAERSALVAPLGAYVVDPAAGLESIASLFAVAGVPDTTLLWASVASLGLPYRTLAPGLHAIEPPPVAPTDRSIWGVCTSGSTGAPKVAIGYADFWELIVLHYRGAIFGEVFAGGAPDVFATNLPLQFSGAFFMTVLPSMMLRRELVVFPAHDWGPVLQHVGRGEVFVLTVPALAAAAAMTGRKSTSMDRAALFLGGGYLTAERVRLIRDAFGGVPVANLYGSAETGALAIDHEPGHNTHVGTPIAGKPVWIRDPDDEGIGTVAAAGVDCSVHTWLPGAGLTAHRGFVTGVDYGRFDDRGHLCLEGRVDGAEKLAGMLVYPRAVERHLLALPGVVDARVLVRRGTGGLEHLAAKVVGAVTAGQVREHCEALAEIERPSRIECVTEADAAALYSANGKL
jgi:acyl-coenzyme A synthetase/AMP-(fatty) acid ligase